jgi:hypothetical protein
MEKETEQIANADFMVMVKNIRFVVSISPVSCEQFVLITFALLHSLCGVAF